MAAVVFAAVAVVEGARVRVDGDAAGRGARVGGQRYSAANRHFRPVGGHIIC
jgi:hypothetical protein